MRQVDIGLAVHHINSGKEVNVTVWNEERGYNYNVKYKRIGFDLYHQLNDKSWDTISNIDWIEIRDGKWFI